MSLKSTKKQTAGDKTFAAAIAPLAPIVSSYAITGTDDTALDPAGGQTILINGTGFKSGATITLSGTAVSIVSYVSPNQLSFTSPAKSAGTYTIYVTNTDGGTGIYAPGIVYSTFPTWTTSAGSIGSYYETQNISNTFVATSDSAIANYTVVSGALPSGATLYANGVLSGTAPVDSGSTTYNFTIQATDTELQDSTRSFSLTINTDVVTWTSPADGTTYTSSGETISNVTLSATSAVGSNVSYSANALPTGITLTGNTISGTPTVAGNTTTLLTATAATTTRSATRTINWAVTLGDTYWKQVSLLLNGSTPTTTFINDASLNNNQLTIAGDTKPSNFDPYMGGYYSNYFDGTGDYLTITTNLTAISFGTGDFTVECWMNFNSVAADCGILGSGSGGYDFVWRTSTGLNIGRINTAFDYTFAWTPTVGQWYHVAYSRSSTSLKVFVNGTQVGTTVTANADYSAATYAVIGASTTVPDRPMNGYISNLRLLKGTALYTTNFTPPTQPLTAVANTGLLTCQSNRLIDNSNNNIAITKNGDTTVSSAHPFVTPTTAPYNTLYSAYFDAANPDYITVANTTNLQPGTGDFTYELWFYPTNLTGTQEIVSKGNGVQIYTSGTTLKMALSASNSTTYFINATVGTLANYIWYHIALVRSGNNYYAYLNGTRSTLGTSASSPSTGTDSLFIGAFASALYPTYGIVSNLRFVKGTAVYTAATITVPTSSLTAISDTQLLTCQDATFKDNSSNGYTINSFNKARPIAASPFTMTTSNTTVTSLGSTYFDGTGDGLSTAASGAYLFDTGDFTVECWVYPTITTQPTYAGIVNQTGTGAAWFLSYYTSNTVRWTNYATVFLTSPTSVVPNKWTHIVVSRKGTSLKMFFDGVQVATATDSTSFGVSTSGVDIGKNATYYYSGYISDVRIVKGTALYTANFLPPQTPLTAVTNTQLLTLQYNGGATNNSFVDQSSFNNLITRAGNATQGTFSPYSQTGWSNYFDGSGDYLSIADNTNFEIGANIDFTIEMWFNIRFSGSGGCLLAKGTGFSNPYYFYTSDANNSLRYYSSGNGSSWNIVDGNTNAGLLGSGLTNGAWYHVAVSREGTNTRLFLNGSLVNTIANSGSALVDNASPLTIGSRSDGSEALPGYVSNVRFVKGTAVYTGAFTPSTSPLTAITNTVLLTCQNNRFIDNSVNNHTITRAGDVSVQAFSPFGGVTSVPTSYSVYFDGSGDYIRMTEPSSTASDVTVECWVFPTVTTARGFVVSAGGNSTGAWAISISAANTVEVWADSYSSVKFTTVLTVTDNTWNHLALVKTSGVIKIYVNGVLDAGSYTQSGNFGYPTSTNITLGAYNISLNQLFFGYISNFRYVQGTALYSGSTITVPTSPLTAVSGTQVLTCQSATLIDISTNYFTITVTGDSKPLPFNPFGLTNTTGVSYTPSVNGGSMYFDGTGDYLTIGTTQLWTPANSFTIECWFNVGSFADNRSIFSKDAGTTSSSRGLLIYITSTGAVSTFYSVSGSSEAFSTSSTGLVVLNQWYHYALVKNGSTCTQYLNGVSVATFTAATIACPASPTNYVGIFNASWPMLGYITDFRIINGAALYTSNFYPGSAPLTPTATIGATTYSSSLLLNGTSGGIIDYHTITDLETVGNTQLVSEDPYAGSYYSNYFDGTGDYISLTGSTPIQFGSGDFTIECWIWTSSNSAGTFYGDRNGANFTGMVIGLSTAKVYLLMSTGSSWNINTYSVTTGSSITLNAWNHVAVCRSSSTITVFINGTSSYTQSFTGSLAQSSTVRIGAEAGDTAAFAGYISNFRMVKGTALYTTTFTPSTTALTAISGTGLLTCQSNTFKDNSTNAFAITRTGDTKVKSMNPFQQNTGKSLYFDGTGDWLYSPSSASLSFGTGDFTVEFWVYMNGLGTQRFFAGTTAAGSDTIMLYLFNGSEFSILINGAVSNPTATIITYQWNHMAVTRQNGTVRRFLNGTQIGADWTGVTGSIDNTRVTVGNGVQYTGPVNGYMKDFRVTKGYARYTTTFTPPTEPLPIK